MPSFGAKARTVAFATLINSVITKMSGLLSLFVCLQQLESLLMMLSTQCYQTKILLTTTFTARPTSQSARTRLLNVTMCYNVT